MTKSAFFVFLLILMLGATTAFALTNDEYQTLISTSQAFREVDEELGRVWKEVYGELSEQDKNITWMHNVNGSGNGGMKMRWGS